MNIYLVTQEKETKANRDWTGIERRENYTTCRILNRHSQSDPMNSIGSYSTVGFHGDAIFRWLDGTLLDLFNNSG